MESYFFFFFPPFSLSARLQFWHGLNPWQSPLLSYHSFFFSSLLFSPLLHFFISPPFFILFLSSNFFLPFSSAFLPFFLSPNSFSSFFPFLLVLFSLFPPLFYSPGFFFPSPSYIFSFISFSLLNHFHLFHLFAKGAAINKIKKIKAEQCKRLVSSTINIISSSSLPYRLHRPPQSLTKILGRTLCTTLSST